MDKRTTLALALTALVMMAPLFLFPRRPLPVPIDTTGAVTIPARPVDSAPPRTPTSPTPPVSGVTTPSGARSAGIDSAPAPAPARVDSFRVARGSAQITYVAPFAAPAIIDLPGYRDLSPRRAPHASIAHAGIGGVESGRAPLLRYRLVMGRDTVAVSQLPVRGEPFADGVRFESPDGVNIEYRAAERDFVTRVEGRVPAEVTTLLVDLPDGLESFEADTLDDQRHRAFGHKPVGADISSISLTSLDSTKIRTDSGPMHWVAARNKYFLIALIADSTQPFDLLRMRGGTRTGKDVAIAYATAALPIKDGRFAFDMYTGPQSWSQLRAIGRDLENVNPYGGWAHNMAQPFVEIVMQLLLWLKRVMGTNYGWVLVMFGVIVRLLMWPLNQSAMRSSLKMQRLQPEMEAVKKRYPNDREAQQRAMMKVYQDHGMNPLTPLLGCLPMLLPMPVLFALYFVFVNTIEFRGVPFLWLPDLSLRDPFFITPVFMGASMFLLSWLGARNAPPNPQTKVMMYMMPAFMTFLFLSFPAGLNLYYGVQNVVALPQQWLLARERLKKSG